MISSFFRPVPVKPLSADEQRLLLEQAIDKCPVNDGLVFSSLVGRLEVFCQQEQSDETRKKLAALIYKLGTKAETADQYYMLAILQKGYPFLGKGEGPYLQTAARLGHPQALRQVASYALLGYYANKSQPVSWAIHCLKFLLSFNTNDLKNPALIPFLTQDLSYTINRHNFDPSHLARIVSEELNQFIEEFAKQCRNGSSEFTLTQPASSLFYSGSFVKPEEMPPPLEENDNAEEHESEMGNIEDESDLHKIKMGM